MANSKSGSQAQTLGKLYLIPTPLLDQPLEQALTSYVISIVSQLDYFIVENAKSARAFLKQVGTNLPLQQLKLEELNEHTPEERIDSFLSPLLHGNSCGILSEAGVPCLADPGANLVARAYQLGIVVEPLVGPSAVLLAIISSGLSGQNFSFLGYLPAKSPERENRIRELEQLSLERKQSQFFIETPYRAQKLFSALLENCKGATRIAVGVNLGSSRAWSHMKTVREWREKGALELEDQLVVFGLQAV